MKAEGPFHNFFFVLICVSSPLFPDVFALFLLLLQKLRRDSRAELDVREPTKDEDVFEDLKFLRQSSASR